MRLVIDRALALVACLAVPLITGCSSAAHSANMTNAANPADDVPLYLRGQYVTLRLEFPQTAQKINPGRFQHDEICYLNAGEFRIDCFADGSTLSHGPNDANDLLTDHAPSTLEPADDNARASQSMHLYALVTLIGGSVDRLPSTLADYLQNPGQHLAAAMDLANALLGDKPVQFLGFARGGNFVVTVQLGDAGREKIVDALDEQSGSAGELQYVYSHDAPTPRSFHSTKFEAIQSQRPIRSKPRSRTLDLGAHDESHVAASVGNGPSRSSRTKASQESRVTGCSSR